MGHDKRVALPQKYRYNKNVKDVSHFRKEQTMLELIDICFERNHKKILDHIHLTLDEKKFYVITGPNGSGKSTLAKIIMGLEQPDSGQILFQGKDITHLSVSERAQLGISYAFQQPVTFKGITVFDLLKIAVGLEMTEEDALELLKKVGITSREYLHRELNRSLSGGERKRIEIASVLSRHPMVAIFDEPEAGIDLWSFQSLTEIFKELASTSSGMTIVISHQERIMKLADQMILLDHGTIKKIGDRKEMLSEILEEMEDAYE